MSATGIDYTIMPPPGSIKAAGHDFVIRHFGDETALILTLSEAKSLTEAGLGILSVWQTDPAKFAGGTSEGIYAATQSVTQLERSGGPDGSVLYFRLPADAELDLTLSFFDGIGTVIDNPLTIGVQGNAVLCYELFRRGVAAYSIVESSDLWLSTAAGFRPDVIESGRPEFVQGVPVIGFQTSVPFYGQWFVDELGHPRTAYETYTVLAGDNLTEIARRFGLDWSTIWYFNTNPRNRPAQEVSSLQSRGPNLLMAGEVLYIPRVW